MRRFHFHAGQLRSLARRHLRVAFNLLFQLGWKTLASFGLRDKALKGRLGATAVPHTHTRKLDYHPHVHWIVPAGALDAKHRLWRRKGGKYLFRHNSLARVFRAKWLQALKDYGLTVESRLPENGRSIASTWAVATRPSPILANTSIVPC